MNDAKKVGSSDGDQTEALASAISSFLFPRKRFQTPPAKEGPNSFDMVG
jgi:hypothetical protein